MSDILGVVEKRLLSKLRPRVRSWQVFGGREKNTQVSNLVDMQVRILRGETRGPNSRLGPLPPPPPGKAQVAKGFFRNTGTDPLEKQLGPSGLMAS